MSDLFHCYDGCAPRVWEGGKKQAAKQEKQAEKRRDEDEATEESDLSSDEELGGDTLPLVAGGRQKRCFMLTEVTFRSGFETIVLCVLARVANQLSVFVWPSTEQVMRQY